MSNNTNHLSGFGSLAVHGGHQQDPNYAHLTPIYATSTFVYDDAEQGCDDSVARKKVIFIAAGAILLLQKRKKKSLPWKALV